MATTPEGRVKSRLRELFAQYDGMYSYWPVPSGFGKTTLDVLGCYRGKFFSVETKAEGKKPTLRQTEEIKHIEYAMGKAFVMSGEASPVFDELREWLDLLTTTVPHDPHISPDQVNRRPL